VSTPGVRSNLSCSSSILQFYSSTLALDNIFLRNVCCARSFFFYKVGLGDGSVTVTLHFGGNESLVILFLVIEASRKGFLCYKEKLLILLPG